MTLPGEEHTEIHPQKCYLQHNHPQQIYLPQGDPQIYSMYPPEGYPQPVPQGYPQQVPPGYPQQVPPGYPQQIPQGYPQQVPPGYPQQMPQGYPQQVPQGYFQQGYPQQQGFAVQEVGSRTPSYRRGRRSQDRNYSESGRFSSSFEDPIIRANFIRKVYSILTVQLFFTAGICALFMFIEELKTFIRENFYIIYIALGVYLVFFIILICFSSLRRKTPINYILLFFLTLSLSVMLGAITSVYDTMTVLLALVTTVAVCLIVTLLACQTSLDITNCGTFLCIISMAFIIFCLTATMIQIFYRYSKTLHLVVAGVATVLFCIYLMYDTQQIMGGKRIEISPEEYILGAVQLYVDIAYIFLNILTIFGALRN